jgi:hypothetical protein
LQLRDPAGYLRHPAFRQSIASECAVTQDLSAS